MPGRKNAGTRGTGPEADAARREARATSWRRALSLLRGDGSRPEQSKSPLKRAQDRVLGGGLSTGRKRTGLRRSSHVNVARARASPQNVETRCTGVAVNAPSVWHPCLPGPPGAGPCLPVVFPRNWRLLLDKDVVLDREGAGDAVGQQSGQVFVGFLGNRPHQRHIAVLDDDVNRGTARMA